MKNLYKILMCTVLLSTISCKKTFLDEKPLDFASTVNSFSTLKDFNASVYNLYNLVRTEFYTYDEQSPFDYIYGLDLVYDGQPSGPQRFSDYAVSTNPSNGYLTIHWTNLYKIISEANTILNRLPSSSVTGADANIVQANARFFRGFAYRTLAYLYGGVPLVLKEVTSPKTDFVRASQADVYKQVIDDLMFAAANLPAISAVQDGQISKTAAQHLLAEVYLAAGQFNNAVTTASLVIDDGNMALMKTRFGSQSADPGDVYWDLFRPKNQNRSSGNKEAIWVIQFENDVPGGSSSATSINGSYRLERQHAPLIRDLTLSGGAKPFLWPVSDYTGGRGIGWAISTRYFTNSIWTSDFSNDMRNSNYNFVRTFTYNDPAKPAYFGQNVSTENPPAGVTVPSRAFYAYQSKCTTPGKHPDGLFINKSTFLLSSAAGGTYCNQYMFRLAETYLIRAEAYLGAGSLENAAKDINVVRARANASPVLSSAVNINYILDERMRELGVEEKRRLTLARLNLVYDRTVNVAHNPVAANIKPTNNLWPIPQSEIERNKDAKLIQNPGY
ncbi:RagB/SusD family nutrient uptake outer membrane protein [Mucilaginibacter rubeus]|uniref:RagB/SusD family nutrient uptake outer membrane protein n=1 Tax=Mucilaginibacter rubeus TaxID=2027860 RepID=UPI001665AC1E|nr:RagB/SusD family nutrient uptake outer membrane protein [Mucilaginibacter rubeus]GGB23629.1 hypothetical protein GCM10011500_44840 [Mucilaginibacter rubeus]